MKERKRKDFVLHDKSLSHTNIDIILETKLEALANTRVFTYRIPEKRTVAEYGLLCSPTNPDVETKNIVLLNALDLNTFIFPNLINTVITNAINDAGRLYDSTKDPLTNLSFIIPISYAIGNWAVAYLSSLGGGAGYSLIYINSITNAGKETRNTDYKLIYDILSKLGIAKDEDLSCNQQNYSKDGKSSLWPSGHILIDNIERLCTKRPIIKANFCTDLIKKELLDDSTTTLKVALELSLKPKNTEGINKAIKSESEQQPVTKIMKKTNSVEDKTAEYAVAAAVHKSTIEQLLKDSSEILREYFSNDNIPHMLSNSEKIKEQLNSIYYDIGVMLSLFNGTMKNEQLEQHDKMYRMLYANLKNVLRLQDAWSVIFAAKLQFSVKVLWEKRQALAVAKSAEKMAPNVVQYFFEILPTQIKNINNKDLKKFPMLQDISRKHTEYLSQETKILTAPPRVLTLKMSEVNDFFVKAKKLFLTIKPIFDIYNRDATKTKMFHEDLISKQVTRLIEFCDDIFTQIKAFESESKTLFNLKDPKVEQLLLKEEQELAEKKKAEQDKKLQNAARDAAFRSALKQKFKLNLNASKNTAAAPCNESEHEPAPEQIINNTIEAYKNSIDRIERIEDLQKQVDKISSLESRVIAKGWTLSVAQKLNLAECLVLSVFFAQNMIHDIESLEQLQQKILSLCLDDKQLTLDERLRSNIIAADLFNIYARVLYKKCGNEKYKLVDYDCLNRPWIVISADVAKEKFMLFALYKKTMQQLNTYVKAANEVLVELIYPQNSDGLEWSLKQYKQCQDEYALTLAHLEEEQEEAKEQRIYYKKNIKPKLVRKQRNESPTPSNATVVQSMLREFIFNSKKIDQMKQLGSQCAESIELINRTFKVKIESKDTSLAYLDGMTYAYARSRSKSLNEYVLNNDVLDVAGTEVVRPRCGSLY